MSGRTVLVAAMALMLADPAAAAARHHTRPYPRPKPQLAPAAAQPPSTPGVCERQCLAGRIDKVLQAMVDHAPAEAGLATDVRYSENGQPVPVGQGLWRSASAIAMQGDGLSSLGASSSAYRLYLADVAGQEAGYLGAVTENGAPAMVALHVKLVAGQVTQVEAVVVRRSDGGAFALDPRGFSSPEPALLATDGTASRGEVVAAVNGYFQVMRGDPGAGAPVAPDCARRINGRPFGCAPWPSAEVRDGHVMVADLDRGLVLTSAVLEPRGVLPGPLVSASLFKLRGAQIARIQTLQAPVGAAAAAPLTAAPLAPPPATPAAR